MKVTYQTWWQVFFDKYRIKDHIEVEISGIYYNETLEFYEAHFKPDNSPTKVVARISKKMLEESEPIESSKLVKELTEHLSSYFARRKVDLDVPQFGKIDEVIG